MELAVYNIKGEDTGRKVTLNDEIFAIAEPNEHAVYLDVKQYMANKRQGTHKAKEMTSSLRCSMVVVACSVPVPATTASS